MTLNSTNWSVQLLSRHTTGPENANDSLEQFVAILSHLPNDCTKLVRWIYNEDRMNFLPMGVATATPPPSINQQSPIYQSRYSDSNRPQVRNKKANLKHIFLEYIPDVLSTTT
jgi:hypothetical protein